MARRKKRPRPRAKRPRLPLPEAMKRAVQLSPRSCLTWGQIANRIEYAAGEAARSIQNGVDLKSLRFGIDTAEAEASRLALLVPALAKEANDVERRASALAKEVRGKTKLSPADAKKLKSSFLTLRDKAQQLMDKGESACPL